VRLRALVGVLASVLFLWLALRDASLADFAGALRGVNPLFLTLAALASLLGVGLRALRWHVMVAPLGPITRARLFVVFVIGSMANTVLPVRLGELVRAYLLGRSARVSTSGALATIVYERVVDVFAALALLWVALMIAPAPPWLRASGAWVLAANSLLMGLIVLMVLIPGPVANLVARLARPFGARAHRFVHGACEAFAAGLGSVRSLRATLLILAQTVAVTAASVLPVYLCFGATGIAPTISAAVVVTVLVSFASMIPAAPGNVGPIQYACVVALGLYRVDRGAGLAYSVIFQLTQYVPVTVLGLALLWREQIGLFQLARRAPLPSLGDDHVRDAEQGPAEGQSPEQPE